MCVKVDSGPTALSTRVPWIKADRHFVLGSAGNGVPGPGDSFFDVGRLGLNKPWRATWITVHVQEFIRRVVVSHQITELQELVSRPDPVRSGAFSNQNSSRREAIYVVNHWNGSSRWRVHVSPLVS